MVKNFYIPEGISADYKFIVPYGEYFDLYNTTNLVSGNNYTFYRFYYNLDKDIYTINNNSVFEDIQLNYVEINPTNSYIYRDDFPQILFISSTIILFLVILINIFTSIIKRGGVFGGLL